MSAPRAMPPILPSSVQGGPVPELLAIQRQTEANLAMMQDLAHARAIGTKAAEDAVVAKYKSTNANILAPSK